MSISFFDFGAKCSKIWFNLQPFTILFWLKEIKFNNIFAKVGKSSEKKKLSKFFTVLGWGIRSRINWEKWTPERGKREPGG